MIILVLFCIVFSSTLNANDFAPEKETFIETFDPNVPVSGSVVLGVSLSDNAIPSQNMKLYTFIKPELPWLCVSVKSIDGQYLASSIYHTEKEIY